MATKLFLLHEAALSEKRRIIRKSDKTETQDVLCSCSECNAEHNRAQTDRGFLMGVKIHCRDVSERSCCTLHPREVLAWTCFSVFCSCVCLFLSFLTPTGHNKKSLVLMEIFPIILFSELRINSLM